MCRNRVAIIIESISIVLVLSVAEFCSKQDCSFTCSQKAQMNHPLCPPHKINLYNNYTNGLILMSRVQKTYFRTSSSVRWRVRTEIFIRDQWFPSRGPNAKWWSYWSTIFTHALFWWACVRSYRLCPDEAGLLTTTPVKPKKTWRWNPFVPHGK